MAVNHFQAQCQGVYSLVPRPCSKNWERGLVALPCIFCRYCKRHQTRATVGYALLQPLMSADYHANACKSELNKRCCSMLFSVFIQFGCTLSIHKFRQIVSVDWDLSQCLQTIGEFVLITYMGKQRSPISIVHRPPPNATPLPHVCRRHRRCHRELL